MHANANAISVILLLKRRRFETGWIDAKYTKILK